MRFWDSSALVPLLVRQAATERMTGLYRADVSILTWWCTRVECDSAIARLERQTELAPDAATAALRRLDLLARSWHEIQPLDLLRETARRLLRVHNLRTAHSLQIAAALQAAEQRPATLEFVCLDERLTLAAQREGFPVVAGVVKYDREEPRL